jgi:SAM-dependent methyltransferase
MSQSQTWDPVRYANNARFVADLGMPVVELLAARPGERVLDLGCGDGALTLKLVSLGCSVVGVDGSAAQIHAARKLGLDARVMDGEALAFSEEFDAVFSNAALHWMKRAEAVIEGVWRALRPGGRFVAECGGEGCVATIRRALVAALDRRGIDGESRVPWYFPTVDEYRERLARGGFDVVYIERILRPTPLPAELRAWLETFGESFTRALPPSERDAYLREVQDELRPALMDEGGKWTADYTRLRFSAIKRA